MTELDHTIARWLQAGPDRGSPGALDAALARLPDVGQRPGWVVALGGGTVTARPVDRRLRVGLAAVVVALVLVAGGLFVSGAINPAPDPSATIQPSPTPDGTPIPLAAADVVVFRERRDVANGEEGCTSRFGCTFQWVATINVDGTGQHRLFPDGPTYQGVAAVSPDGRRLIVQGIVEGEERFNPPYYLTDLEGSAPLAIDLGCAAPCTDDFVSAFAFSPDGSRVAFVRMVTEVPGQGEGTSSVIAVLDLASGTVTELGSTFASNPDLGGNCGLACGAGTDDSPRWSPDGNRLLFSRSGIGLPNQPRSVLDTALFIVDVDGANLRQLVPLELFARDAQWSPDGERILFTSAIETLTVDEFGKLENWHQLNDIYTVRPDGSDIRRLTSFTAGPAPDQPGDLGPEEATWTRDGRSVFNRRAYSNGNPEELHWEPWAMDADGANLATLTSIDVAALTELGCVDCAYPKPDDGDYPIFAFWRPRP